MRRYWATFARTGSPGDGSYDWPALQTGTGNVLRFQPKGDVVIPSAEMWAEHRWAFWAQVGY